MTNSLKEMWKNIMSKRAMTEVAEPRKRAPELHCCPHCGAGITRLRLINGGILPSGAQRRVRAAIGCRQCGRQHLLKGDTLFEVAVVLMLLKGKVRGYWISGGVA